MPARRGWRSARTQGWRSPNSASPSPNSSPALCGPRTVWTTGRITLDPGAPSIIPGRADMLFQIRDDNPAVIERLEEELRRMAAEMTAAGRAAVTVERIRTGVPALMNDTFQEAIEAASKARAGGKSVRMPSGAGHDAQVLSTIMPFGHAVRALRSAASAITGPKTPTDADIVRAGGVSSTRLRLGLSALAGDAGGTVQQPSF